MTLPKTRPVWQNQRSPNLNPRCGWILTIWFVVLASPAILAQQPIFTNEEVFFVPFATANSASDEAPKMVELFVSADRGGNWTLYQQRNPSEGRFSFRAGADGEYWFAVRTIPATGNVNSTPIQKPEMIVVVDREQPRLEIATQLTPGGEIYAEWQVTDSSIAPSDFILEYKTPGEEWQEVQIHSRSMILKQGTLIGRASWRPLGSLPELSVRAQIRDKAGNAAMVERVIALPNQSATEAIVSMPLPAEISDQPNSDTSSLPEVYAMNNSSATNDPTWIPQRAEHSPTAPGPADGWQATKAAPEPYVNGSPPAASDQAVGPLPQIATFKPPRAQQNDLATEAQSTGTDPSPHPRCDQAKFRTPAKPAGCFFGRNDLDGATG